MCINMKYYVLKCYNGRLLIVTSKLEAGLSLRGTDTTTGSAALTTVWWVIFWIGLIVVLLWLYRYCCQERHGYEPIA